MGTNQQSIFRFFLISAGLPVMLIVVLVVGWMATLRIDRYLEAREAKLSDIGQIVVQMEYYPDQHQAEIAMIRREHMADLNRRFGQEMILSVTILALGLLVPLITARHLSKLVGANLQLLEEHMAQAGPGGSSLMPRTFDFKEFGSVVATLRTTLHERSEAERRWRRAEQELVDANADLIKRARELQDGRRIALSMMEDAELARVELEAINTRLGEVIEQAKSAAHHADVANEAKSSFLATMSHEIRTPLNGVIGFIDMLSQTELNAEQQEYIQSLQMSSETLMALINDILDFSKIESGRMEFETRSINLVRLLRETTQLFLVKPPRRGWSLNWISAKRFRVWCVVMRPAFVKY